jgi:sigma-B regulation protein RsbU (phosphoserine phosphatase)
MLLIYTDGIPDSINPQKGDFGYDGVVRTVAKMTGSPAPMVCEALIRAANAHQAGAPQHDDMTVVVLRAV